MKLEEKKEERKLLARLISSGLFEEITVRKIPDLRDPENLRVIIEIEGTVLLPKEETLNGLRSKPVAKIIEEILSSSVSLN